MGTYVLGKLKGDDEFEHEIDGVVEGISVMDNYWGKDMDDSEFETHEEYVNKKVLEVLKCVGEGFEQRLAVGARFV